MCQERVIAACDIIPNIRFPMATEQITPTQQKAETLNGDDITSRLMDYVLVTIGEHLAEIPYPNIPLKSSLPAGMPIEKINAYYQKMREGWRDGSFLEAVDAMHALAGVITPTSLNYLRAAISISNKNKSFTKKLYKRLALDTMAVGQKPVSQLHELTGDYREETCDYLDSVIQNIPTSPDLDSSAIDFASSRVKHAINKVRQHLRRQTDEDMGYVINAVHSGDVASCADRFLSAKARTPRYAVWVTPFRKLEIEKFYQQVLRRTIRDAHEQYDRGNFPLARQTAAKALALQPEDIDIQKNLQSLIVQATPDTPGKVTLLHALRLEQEGSFQKAYHALKELSGQLPEEHYLLKDIWRIVLARLQQTVAQQMYKGANDLFAILQWTPALQTLLEAEKLGFDQKKIKKLRTKINSFQQAEFMLTVGSIDAARSVWTTAQEDTEYPETTHALKRLIDAQWSQELTRRTISLDDPNDIENKYVEAQDYQNFVTDPTLEATLWLYILGYLRHNNEAAVPEELPHRQQIIQVLEQTRHGDIEEAYMAIGKLEEAKDNIAASILLRIVDTQAEQLHGPEGARRTRLAFLNLAQTK